MTNISNAFDKALEVLENKCINAVDENFNLYLLVDLESVGEVTELFDEVDWYLYYWECAMELNQIINALLLDSSQNNVRLLKAIGIKRAVDERLSFWGKDKNKIYEDLGFSYKIQESSFILLTDVIKNKKFFLEKLYKELISRRWIESSFEVFQSNFENSENQIPINWVGQLKYLVAFAKYLYDKRLIKLGKRKIQQLIVKHFFFKDEQVKIKSVESYLPLTLFDDESVPNEKDFLFIEECSKY